MKSYGWRDWFVDVYHRMFSNKTIKYDVREFLIEQCYTFINDLKPKFKHTFNEPDKLIVEIQKWVYKNIDYLSDYIHHQKPEHWSNVRFTLQEKAGDCEDGAVLIYVLARQAGISPLQMGIMCGDVSDGTTGGTGGHCWVEYYSMDLKDTFKIDWCYHGDFRPLEQRDHTRDNFYKKNWWPTRVNDIKLKIKRI